MMFPLTFLLPVFVGKGVLARIAWPILPVQLDLEMGHKRLQWFGCPLRRVEVERCKLFDLLDDFGEM
jgi:hypothetical protein